MNFTQYAEAFRKKALLNSFSEDEISVCLKYAKPLIERNIPVIYNTTNLSALVGYRKVYIKKAALYTSYFYRKFTISKRNGKPRVISEPLPSLKEIQLWILQNILVNIPVSKFAKAYSHKRDIKDNAKYHVGKDMVLNLDIKDFFPSIRREDVEKLFKSCGYSSNVSNLLSKLCTLNGTLPQGASTSPYLSNLRMVELDAIIGGFCIKEKVRYTRYADDMTFSGSFDHLALIDFVTQTLANEGFNINDSKTKLMRQNVPQVVTGIVVNRKTQVSRQKRQNLRLELYFVKKHGIEKHLTKINSRKDNYIHHLLGRLNYFLFLNPEDTEFKKYKEFIIENYIKFDKSKLDNTEDRLGK